MRISTALASSTSSGTRVPGPVIKFPASHHRRIAPKRRSVLIFPKPSAASYKAEPPAVDGGAYAGKYGQAGAISSRRLSKLSGSIGVLERVGGALDHGADGE